jgi:hypothetical protein
LSAKEFELITPEQKGILGSMDEAGVVTFFIAAGEGSSIRGTELFNRMMQFFGNDVQAIHGVWVHNTQGLPSTNIAKVNELTKAGLPLEEAIQQAWTVTRARKLGFQRVRLLNIPEGALGAYTKVEVLIER